MYRLVKNKILECTRIYFVGLSEEVYKANTGGSSEDNSLNNNIFLPNSSSLIIIFVSELYETPKTDLNHISDATLVGKRPLNSDFREAVHSKRNHNA